MGSEFSSLVGELGGLFRGGGAGRTVADSLLNALGPAGKLMRSMMDSGRRASLQRDLKAAGGLLRAFGGQVMGKPGPGRYDLGDAMASVDEVAERLRSYGFEVMPPGTRRPGEQRPTSRAGATKRPPSGRRSVKINMRDGSNRTFAKTHPIVTGEMVRTPSSTSVYAFGYDAAEARLYVRFRKDDQAGGRLRNGGKSKAKINGKSDRPGPLYRYSGVTPEEFLELLKLKNKGGGSGPGKWVWDVLRVRGTVSGHRKDYELTGTVGDYVPRKATAMPSDDGASVDEWLVQRTAQTTGGRTVTSKQPNTRVTAPRGGFQPIPPR